MAIREDKIGQTIFFKQEDIVPEGHICNLVIAIVDKVDVSGIEEKYIGKAGNPAYSRKMLLRLLVQAAVDGVWASRKIAKLAHENMVYMYLTGHEKPDFRTIALFRRDNKDLLERTFKAVVGIARATGILDLNHLSTDGTKIKANASNNHVLTKKDIDWIKEIIERGIRIDEEEDKLYGDRRGDELPPELNSREKIDEKIREIEQSMAEEDKNQDEMEKRVDEEIEKIEKSRDKKLKRAAKKIIKRHALGDERQKKKVMEKIGKVEEEIENSGQDAVSLTDPEARFMENKKKRKELSYNPQITVDHGSGIIVANEVTQDCTDHYQLQPQIEKTEENVGKLPEGTKISDDNGYFNGPNLRYLENKKLDGYIPDKKLASEMKGKKSKDSPYSKDKFEYDDKKDQFVCPQGEILLMRGEYEYNGKPQHIYYGAGCSQCPVRSECAGKNKMRKITSYGYEAERRRMAAKMRSEEGKKEYKKRGETAEWPFGNIKQNLGFREFMTRGLEGVGIEFNLACISHNLKVMWNKLGGNIAVIGDIGSSVANSAVKTGGFLGSRLIVNVMRLLGLGC
jgi:transposase